jgi:beta-mannosidase
VHLEAAALKVDAAGEKGKYTIRVTSPVLARDVYLTFGNLEVNVSDNYFDVLPGETVTITATTTTSLEELKAQLKAISLSDAFKYE